MCYFFAATNGVVLATEKKQKSILYDEQSIHKIEMITKNIGMVYSGMGPDYRYLSMNMTWLKLHDPDCFEKYYHLFVKLKKD